MGLAAGVPPLTTFYVYLTSGCNCACRHCWIVPATAGERLWLAPETLRRAIEQALPLGLEAIKWTGGEPTFHPQFPAFLALQREFGLSGDLETNGMLVDRLLVERLVVAGVRNVSVSLDGATPDTHDAIRGLAGAFQRTCAGIRALVAGGCRPQLILTLQRANFGELDAFLRLAEELGAGDVKLNILQPMLRGADLAKGGEALSVGELIALANRLESVGQGSRLPVALDIPMAFRPISRIFDGRGCGTCRINNILGIIPSGDYALCGVGQHVPALVMGKVADVSLAAIWHAHPVLASLRGGLPGALRGICGECLMKAACLGSCVAVNYQQSGELLAPYWFCQAAADAGLFPASRRS